MADVTVGGGANGAVFPTSLTPSEASLATSLLQKFKASNVEYKDGTTTPSTITLDGTHPKNLKVLILSDKLPTSADTLVSNTSGSILVGNQGNDSFRLSRPGTVIGGDGNNTVKAAGGGHSFISAGNGANYVSVTGFANIQLGDGNDTVAMGIGHVTVGGGSDVITATGRSSITQVGIGGSDTIDLGRTTSQVSVEGRATIHGAGGTTAYLNGATFSERSENGRERFEVSGASTLIGGAAGEVLKGSNGAELRAAAGGDTLQGYSGNVLLDGGAGKDHFVFNRPGSGIFHDTVANFTHGADKIQIGGEVSIKALLKGTGHSGNSVTYGGGNAVIHLANGSTITLVGITSLTNSDFGSGT